METKTKKSILKKWWFWLIVIAVIAIALARQGGNSFSRAGAEGKPDLVTAKRPADEVEFIRIISSAQQQATDAKNDMQKGGIKAERDKAICQAMQSLAAQNWTGRISKITANSDGKGVLEIEIAKDIFIKTWNNALSDIGDQTLLDPSSPIFLAASAMEKGSPVSIKGTFLRDSNDCIKEGSMRLSGKLSDPEFLFRFDSIAVLTDNPATATAPAALPAKTSQIKADDAVNAEKAAADAKTKAAQEQASKPIEDQGPISDAEMQKKIDNEASREKELVNCPKANQITGRDGELHCDN